MKFSTTVLCCLWSLICLSQNYVADREVDSLFYLIGRDSLSHLYGQNKKIPKEHELPVLSALSYFPELKNTRIVFEKSRIKTTLNARPTIFSLLFNKKTKRKYIIRINCRTADSIISLEKVPLFAKIGLFGHEFSHFVDYEGKNARQIFGRLLSYTNLRRKELFEKEIDSITVSRGLGWHLCRWSFFAINESNAKHQYREFKKQIYLEPDEILAMMKRMQYKDLEK